MSLYYLTKLVLQTQSPMAINTGQRETGFDSQLIRDVNGLPMIPATAIAGVWASIAQAVEGVEFKEKWLGGQNVNDKNEREMIASRVSIQNGRLLNSKNQFIAPFELQDPTQDLITDLCRQKRPHHRERVSLNDRGVAKEHGKFDQIVLPKGMRFSVTFKLEAEDEAEIEAFQSLLALWQDPRMAFGSGTRNGLGRVVVIAHESQSFNLSGGVKVAQEMQTFLSSPAKSMQTFKAETNNSLELLAQIPLQAVDNWRYGQGVRPLTEGHDGRNADILTYTEPQIEWKNDQAVIVQDQVVFCGSSIKGILAHRIAFHYRRHIGEFAESMAEKKHDEWETKPEGLNALFGFADKEDHETSRAGMLFVEDAVVQYQEAFVRYHNSIDRFTGGVRQGALYTEELLYQPKFTLRLWIVRNAELSSELKLAIADTLEDIQLGLLPMGAGSGRGTSLVIFDETQKELLKINSACLSEGESEGVQ